MIMIMTMMVFRFVGAEGHSGLNEMTTGCDVNEIKSIRRLTEAVQKIICRRSKVIYSFWN